MTTQQTQNNKVETPVIYNAEVKSFKQTITDSETGIAVRHLYYLKIVRGNTTVQINVGEKTYTQVKTLTDEQETTKKGQGGNKS